MRQQHIIVRAAETQDIAGISVVRTSVRENRLNAAQLAALGITPESVAASFAADSRGWVADLGGQIVAFAIADRATASVFALFVLPDFERRGLGRELLARAVHWLWEEGMDSIWLTTGIGTRAARFYGQAGWQQTATQANGELRFELRRPAST